MLVAFHGYSFLFKMMEPHWEYLWHHSFMYINYVHQLWGFGNHVSHLITDFHAYVLYCQKLLMKK